jgi:Arc/MetJ-type ribon-helix-helix transcriptional regulator
MARQKTVTICIKVPESMVKTIDELVERFGYTSRSDLVRDAIRALLREKAREFIVQVANGSQNDRESDAEEAW